MWTIAAQGGWFGLRIGDHLVPSLHSSNEPGKPGWGSFVN